MLQCLLPINSIHIDIGYYKYSHLQLKKTNARESLEMEKFSELYPDMAPDTMVTAKPKEKRVGICLMIM